MKGKFSVPIEKIADLLGLERSPRCRPGARSFKVHCPFCHHRGYTMDVDTSMDVYHCFHCPADMQKNTGALDLYSRVRCGHPLNRGDAGKVFRQLCSELDIKTRDPVHSSVRVIRDDNVYPASDKALDRAYSALLALPYLKLSGPHIENLKGRGLPEPEARERKFATLPQSAVLIDGHAGGKNLEDLYERENIDAVRKKSPVLCSVPPKDIVAGALIAKDLQKQGISLSGVPGFYRLTPELWSFRYTAGMLIPTVSYDGNIVGIQTRRDTTGKGGPRYITLSSKGLPDGVTSGISRIHVCRNRNAISGNTAVYITEGPLKAEMILWFLSILSPKSDAAVIALQGVNNTHELPDIARRLRRDGVARIQSAFDMDKCCNTAVADASLKMKQIFNREQIAVDVLCWDEEYAYRKRRELAELAEKNQISFAETMNPFSDIAVLARNLSESDIEYTAKIENGVRVKESWRKESKGFDDYLYSLCRAGMLD